MCGRCGAAVRHSVVFPPACGGGGAHLGGGGAAVDRQGRVAAQGGAGVGGQVRVAARGGVRLCLHPPPPCARHFAHQRAKCTAVDKLTREGRTALRPSAGGGSVLGGLTRGERTALRPSAGKVHGRRQAGAGRTHGQERGLPCALPPLRSALRPSAGRGEAVGKLPRGEHTGRGGVGPVHFRLCTQ